MYHNARPVMCLSDEDTERGSLRRLGSGRNAKRHNRVSSELSASLPQLNMFLSEAAENEKITNSYLKGVVAFQSRTTCRPSDGPRTKSLMDFTELMFTYKKAVVAQSQETNPSMYAMWNEIVSSTDRKLQKHINGIRLEEEAAHETIREKNET